MNEEIKQFLSEYASGKYKDGLVQLTPSGNFLVFETSDLLVSALEKKYLSERIKRKFDIDIQFVDFDEYLRKSIVFAIGAAIERTIPLELVDVYFELETKNAAYVGVELNADEALLNDEHRRGIASACELVCAAFKIDRVAVSIIFGVASPFTDSIILRTILANAPITLEVLQKVLSEKGRVDVKVLKAQLDRLRRNGLILWQHSGGYAARQPALYLFSNHQSKKSSDIQRALALARKNW